MAKEVPSGTSFHVHKNVGLFMIFDCNTCVFGLFYDRIISIEGSPFVLGKECLLCKVKERITKAVS